MEIDYEDPEQLENKNDDKIAEKFDKLDVSGEVIYVYYLCCNQDNM